MSVFLFFGLIFLLSFILFVVTLVFSYKKKKGLGRWSEPGYSSMMRIRLFVLYIVVFAILALIYFLIPYHGRSGLTFTDKNEIFTIYNLLGIILAEIVLAGFVRMIMRYQAEKKTQSQNIEPQHLNKISKTVRICMYIVFIITIVLWLILKYT